MVTSYRELIVWQRAMDFAASVYAVTRRFPREETYAVTSQLRRAAVSVPTNIAEGHSRGARGAYLNHLSIAAGSLAESETLLLLADRLAYTSEDTTATLLGEADHVGRMLRRLRQNMPRPLDPVESRDARRESPTA
jgi:four helix bundle protein